MIADLVIIFLEGMNIDLFFFVESLTWYIYFGLC
jgi:hypothetical protein